MLSIESQAIVEQSLNIFQDKEIDHLTIARLAGFNDEELNWVKLFWEPAFNKSWIYVHKEMIIDWMGYSNGKNTLNDFYKKIIKEYEENIDYKEISKDDEIVKSFYSESLRKEELPGNRAKYYIITGECFKCLLMSAQTPKGRVIRKFYIKTEDLVILVIEVVKQQTLLLKDKQLNETKEQLLIAESKNLNLKSEIKNIAKVKIDGFIYLATTKQYAKSNIFRFGRTEQIDKRLQKYQVGRVDDDKMYYIFLYQSENTELLERIIRTLLKKFRYSSRKDLYVLSADLIKKYVFDICELFHKQVMPLTNKLIEDNHNTDYTKSVDVEPVNYDSLFDSIEIYEEKEAPQFDYFNQITELASNYEGIQILTTSDNLDTMTDIVKIQCPHLLREIQVRTVLNGGIGCRECEKSRLKREKTQELLPITLENFNDYSVVNLTDEKSEEFNSLGAVDKGRRKSQNEVILRLDNDNMKLISIYENMNDALSLVCIHAHETTTTWNALKRLSGHACRRCREIKKEIDNVRLFKNLTIGELKALALSIGWTFIAKCKESGIYKWKCPNNHIVEKCRREFLRGYCAECKSQN